MGVAEIPIQIDIGFSDAITPKTIEINYPLILSSNDELKIQSYPPESIISEKFHAMVHLGELNSRMKDYYDIWLLLEHYKFNSTDLKDAIENTFKRRHTDIPFERPIALSFPYAETHQLMWLAFLRKFRGQKVEELKKFLFVVDKIWLFLQVPLMAVLNPQEKNKKWLPKKGWV